jgi:hypothetical protein
LKQIEIADKQLMGVIQGFVAKKLEEESPSVGVGLMGHIDAAHDHSNMQMKAQIERAKDISSRRNASKGDV